MSRGMQYRWTAPNPAEDRVRRATADHLARYESIMTDIRSQDLDRYVREEFDDIAEALARAQELLATQPFAARDISRNLGPRVGPLPGIARRLRAEQHRSSGRPATSPSATPSTRPSPRRAAERLGADSSRATEASPAAEELWRAEMARWTDPMAVDLAYADLQQRRADRLHRAQADPAAFQREMAELRRKYQEKADALREEESGTDSAPADDPEPVEDERDGDPEAARRACVGAIVGALRGAGFTTEHRLERTDGGGRVVVVGRRPSGTSAKFEVQLDGTLHCEFEGYKGTACESDIQTVLPRIEDVYGITLDEERVLWRNPDDEDADHRPTPKGGSRHR